MKSNLRMFVKEIKEFLRTYKIYVVPGIFLLFGFGSPIITKLTPEMLGAMMEDIGLNLPEMTWVDSYLQLFNNLTQIGILAVILTTMGTVVDEKRRGITHLILTKPVSRSGYVLAKYAANLLLVSFSTILAFFSTWFYTEILFEGTQFAPGLTATALFLVYAGVILAMTILSSAITKSTVAAGGLAVLGFFTISMLPMFGRVLNKYSPAALLNYANQGFTTTLNTTDVMWAVITSLLTIVALLSLTSFIFNRQEL